ncbi:hypothetical protein COJ01_17970 [Priestia megaterium]|uniref:hypothetical protein n=1 Tax=Priestia megaterium TaxID=1404 RepID=UPI000BF2B1AA|nr:hypothetical protein [Priestia megaterium]PFK99933.1 hypothetical protein COJ01_17970 [Priestia megaterium]
MATPSTTIVLEPEKVTVTTVNEQGIKTIKHTNIETIQEIFMKEQAMETPLLPSQWGVVKYYRKNHYEGYVMTTPATERQVVFASRDTGVPKEFTIPVPPMLWIFEVFTDGNGRKRLRHSMMYVLKHELLSFKDKVLHAPFPNIGVAHGICWGHENPEVPTGKSIQNIPARFFAQPFNFDLSHNRVKEFEWNPDPESEEYSPFNTDCAVYHMVDLSRKLQASKEAGEEFVYPFDSLKSSSTLDVQQAVKNYLPGIFE